MSYVQRIATSSKQIRSVNLAQVLHENTLGQSKGALLQQPVVKDDSTSNQNSHEGGVQLDAINTNLEQMLNQYKGYIIITILAL